MSINFEIKSSICWARIMSNNLDLCPSPSLAQDFAPGTITSLSEVNGPNHVPAEEEWKVLCTGWKAARRWKHSSAFKALPLPPCAFVFYPGRFSSLLLKASLMYADSSVYVCVWDRSRENTSNKRVLLRERGGGLFVHCSYYIQWTTANSGSFSPCQSLWCHNRKASSS